MIRAGEAAKLLAEQTAKAAAEAQAFQDRINKAQSALQNTRVGFAGSSDGGSSVSAIKTVDPTLLRLEELNLLKELAQTDQDRAKIQAQIDAINKRGQEDKLSNLQKEIRLNERLLDIQRQQATGDFAAANRGLDALMRPGLPAFATGVTNFKGGLAIVGERGPELVKLPRGSDVLSNTDSKAMLSSIKMPSISLPEMPSLGNIRADNKGIEARLDRLIAVNGRPGTLIVQSQKPESDAADIYVNLDRRAARSAGVGG